MAGFCPPPDTSKTPCPCFRAECPGTCLRLFPGGLEGIGLCRPGALLATQCERDPGLAILGCLFMPEGANDVSAEADAAAPDGRDPAL